MYLQRLNEGKDPSLDRIVREFDKYYAPPSYAEKLGNGLYGISYTNKYASGRSNDRLEVNLTCGVDTIDNKYSENIAIFYNDEMTYDVQGDSFPYKDYESLVESVAQDVDFMSKAIREFQNKTRQHNLITYDLLNDKFRNKLLREVDNLKKDLDDIVR